MSQLKDLLHDSLISTSHVEKCALLNIENYSVKASSIGYEITSQDIETIIDCFSNPTLARERGIFFNESNYTCLRADEDSIYAKNGNKGLVMVHTLNHVLMGTYAENMYPSVCVEAVEKLAEYFKQKNI